jgi:hypothetical protein
MRGRVLAALVVASVGASTTLSRPPFRLASPPFRLASPLHSPLLGTTPRQDPNFHSNVGRCIDTLQSELPMMLMAEPTLKIFADGVELIDSHSGLVLTGKRSYARALSALRWVASVSLSSADCGALLVFDPIASQIRARWSAKLFVRGREDEPPLVVDGVSIYSLDSTGHIFRHELRSDVPIGRLNLAMPRQLTLASFGFGGEAEELERALANAS